MKTPTYSGLRSPGRSSASYLWYFCNRLTSCSYKKFLRNFVKLEEHLRVFLWSRVEVVINVQNDWIVLYFCNLVTTPKVDSIRSNDELLILYIWTAEEIDPKKISHFKTQLIRLMQLRKESRSGAFSCNIKERLPTFRLFDTLPLSPDRRLEFLLLLFFNKVSNSERFSQVFFGVLAFKIPQRMPKKAKPRIVFLFGEPFFGLRQSRLFGFSW